MTLFEARLTCLTITNEKNKNKNIKTLLPNPTQPMDGPNLCPSLRYNYFVVTLSVGHIGYLDRSLSTGPA